MRAATGLYRGHGFCSFISQRFPRCFIRKTFYLWIFMFWLASFQVLSWICKFSSMNLHGRNPGEHKYLENYLFTNIVSKSHSAQETMIFNLIILLRYIIFLEINQKPHSISLHYYFCNSYCVITIYLFFYILELLRSQRLLSGLCNIEMVDSMVNS